jgi:asparagine synthase (glutamine-hydrolysing)
MCGIAGIFDLREKRSVDSDLLRRITRSLEHRGPDGEGYHAEPGVGLGHRRLAIIDLEGGKQPLFNEDESVAVSYNGEIYNFAPLQRELEARGHAFKTRCDTEVIVHAWEEWGEACVERFNGMFAFAIWDRNKDCLFLARDRVGIKPLYYSVTRDGYLVFASELKAILAHPAVNRDIRSDAVEDYFAFGYVPDPKTILTSAWKLPPGHTLVIGRSESLPKPRQYWDISFGEPLGDDVNLDEEIVERLRASVDRRLIAEVPLGAFLSGGVDSSTIVALMAQLATGAVKTTSISFGDPAYNESQFAKMVADQYQTEHRVRQVEPSDFSLLDTLPDLYDEPFADSSALPTYRVCELARESVTVALSGDGGDENFIGYRRYRWHAYEEMIRSWLPQAVRAPVFGLLGSIYPKLDWAPKFLRAKSTFQALARNSIDAYLHSVGILTSNIRKQLFSKGFIQELDGYTAAEFFREIAAAGPPCDRMQLVQYLDFKTYLPGDILTKVDRASMAHSLEVRVPLLDHEFVEWVARIPPKKKLVGREGKHCFKKAFEPHLPADVLYREKMGFGVPIAAWFRGPLKQHLRDSLSSELLADSGLFDMKSLHRLVDEHQRGAKEHSAVLWALLMFEQSLARVLDERDAIPAIPGVGRQ